MTSANLVAESQCDFHALWCYVWSALALDDRDSQAMAQRLNDQGIFTWKQWADLGYPAAPPVLLATHILPPIANAQH